jgi:hypothetical protein
MSSLIVQIMLVFLAIGAAYGIGAGTITSGSMASTPSPRLSPT